MKLTRAFFRRLDLKVSRYLDRVLPKSLTARYILGLGIIAGLAIIGQAFIQTSLQRQINNQKFIRSLDQQILLADEIRKATLSLQLSSERNEAAQFSVEIRTLIEKLLSEHSRFSEVGIFEKMLSNRAGLMSTRMAALQHLSGELTNLVQGEKRRSGSSLTQETVPTANTLVTLLTNYQLALKDVVKAMERTIDEQVARFKRFEYFLLFFTLLALVLEALYVFRPAVQRLSEAFRVRADFLGRMSHELRNPMNSIIGMMNLLSETSVTQQQKNYLTVLRRSSESLLQMLNSLLDFSIIESGKIKLDSVPFDLYETLERCVDLSVISAHANNTELVVNISPDVPLRMVGDPIRLQQVISNLLGNAVKFTKAGHVTLSVKKLSEKDDVFVRFSVVDTGIGIQKEKIDQIFEPFVQGDSSIRRRYGGSGLGLAIAKELIERMGGQLEVKSEAGRGSEFSFVLPVVTDGQPELTIGKWLELECLPTFEAVVLETDKHVISMLRATLERNGSRLVAVSNVEDLFSHLRPSAHPRIVIINHDTLIGQTHYDAIERLLQNDKSVIFLLKTTASTQSVERLIALNAGAILFKPLKPIQLLKTVRGVLSGKMHSVKTPVPLGIFVGRDDSRPLKILVADDSHDNQVLVQAYLQSSPYLLTFADDGRQAFEEFKKSHFDLVLMDIQMPELDGYEATQRIRSWEREHRPFERPVPIVGISAYSIDDRAKGVGFSSHMVKPISVAQLQKTIQKLTAHIVSAPEARPRAENIESHVKDLAPRYLQNRRRELSELKTMLDQKDFKSIQRIGHRLKGNALSYGFADLGDLGAQMEKAAVASDFAKVSDCVSAIDDFLSKQPNLEHDIGQNAPRP